MWVIQRRIGRQWLAIVGATHRSHWVAVGAASDLQRLHPDWHLRVRQAER